MMKLKAGSQISAADRGEEWAESEARITSRQPSKQRKVTDAIPKAAGGAAGRQVAGSGPGNLTQLISAESSFRAVPRGRSRLRQAARNPRTPGRRRSLIQTGRTAARTDA